MIEIVPELGPYGHCSSPNFSLFMQKTWTISLNQSISIYV